MRDIVFHHGNGLTLQVLNSFDDRGVISGDDDHRQFEIGFGEPQIRGTFFVFGNRRDDIDVALPGLLQNLTPGKIPDRLKAGAHFFRQDPDIVGGDPGKLAIRIEIFHRCPARIDSQLHDRVLLQPGFFSFGQTNLLYRSLQLGPGSDNFIDLCITQGVQPFV